MYHHPNHPKPMLQSLSAWSLSLAMLGICSGQLIAADGSSPVPVKIEKLISYEDFNDQDGTPEDPISVKINGEDGVITLTRGVKSKISGLTWLSYDKVSLRLGSEEYPVLEFNIKKHDFDPAYLSKLSNEERREIKENDREAVKSSMNVQEEKKLEFIDRFIQNALRLTVNFNGGNEAELLAEAARAIEDAYAKQLPNQLKGVLPDQLQLESQKSAHSPRLAPLKLTNVSLDNINEGYFPWRPAGFSLTYPGQHVLSKGTGVELSINYYVDSISQIEFFNIGDISRNHSANNKINVQDVVALFELSWTMGANVVWGSAKFHQETGMLIVKGTSSEIEIAKKSFNRLCGIPNTPNPLDQIINNLEQLVAIQSRSVPTGNESVKKNEQDEDTEQNQEK